MIAFTLGPITVYWYGIMYLISFVLGYLFLSWIGKKEATKKRPTIHTILTTKLDDLIVAIILGVMIGGRLGEILIYNLPYYIESPLKVFYVREGGMSFIGGIVGVVIAVSVFFKIHKISKTAFLRLLDHIVIIVPLGIMLGRIGNFLNRELYGIIATNKAILSSVQNNNRFVYTRETLLVRPDIYTWMEKVGLIFDYGTDIQSLREMRINTNILASFLEGFLLLVVMQLLYWKTYKKGKKKAGRLSGIFLLRYSTIRFFLEFLRQDSQYELVAGLSYSQRWFVGFFLLGVILLIRKPRQSS